MASVYIHIQDEKQRSGFVQGGGGYRHNDTKYKVYFHLYKYTAGEGRGEEGRGGEEAGCSAFSKKGLGGVVGVAEVA